MGMKLNSVSLSGTAVTFCVGSWGFVYSLDFVLGLVGTASPRMALELEGN